MEEMSIFCNKVHQAGQKCDKREAHTKANLHKSNKRHKRQPLSKGPRYEHYTPVKANHTTILEKTFNLERPDNHQAGVRPGGHPEEKNRNQGADRRRAKDRGRQGHQ
ncbi:hypothetical protein JHK84_043502 [Glycine max]|nr:hypothetical protein JHK84_043502 [Glycine max]